MKFFYTEKQKSVYQRGINKRNFIRYRLSRLSEIAAAIKKQLSLYEIFAKYDLRKVLELQLMLIENELMVEDCFCELDKLKE